MYSRFALLTIVWATALCSAQKSVAQPFEAGAKVRVNTSVFNGATATFDSAVRDGTVIDRAEFDVAKYDVAAGKMAESTERVYIVDYGNGHRPVREIYLNSDIKPDDPADALHKEIALQRGTKRPMQRSPKLDAAAAKQALAIANLTDPAAGANLSAQDVGTAIGLEPVNVGVIVSIGNPSAQTVVYGIGGKEATGWIDDRNAWTTLFNERSTEVGVGAAAIKGRAQNLEGPATGVVWVAILTAPKDAPEPTAVPGPIPVGEWAMHQYQGPEDTTGTIIGKITVGESGDYQREVNGKVQTGTLSVTNGLLTVVTKDGKRSSRPIVPLEVDGKVVGYELSDEKSPIEWLVPRQPVPGPIPVGTWAMNEYAGPDDKTGQITGKITVNAAGQFQCERNGEKQTGKLAVADNILTMQFEGGDTGQWPIVPLEVEGQVVGYELSDAKSPIEWLVPRQPVPGPIPVGIWAMHEYAGPNDKTGQITGKITVNAAGQFECERNGEKQTGKLSVADNILTMQFEGGDTGQWPIAPLQDKGKLVGYGLSDAQHPIEWLSPRQPVPGPIPVGTWAMHEYAGPNDKTGQITGKITVNAAGQFQCDRNGEKQTGKLSVADNILTMQFADGETSTWPIAPLQDKGKLVGYGLSNEQHPIEWLVPRQPVAGQIPVGTWEMHEFAGPDDKAGQVTGKITVDAAGQFRYERNGKTQTGKLSVADNILTMQFAEGGTGQWPIAPLQDKGKLVGYGLSDAQHPIEWLAPRQPVPGQIPVGSWEMHEYAGPNDKTGQITGKITVNAAGQFQCDRNGEKQTGKLSVADNILTMQFADGDTSTWPIAPLQDKGKLVGYGLSNAQHPIEWLVPRQPVPGQIPVGTWEMHEFAGADDRKGQVTGKITVNAAGQFQCDRNGEKQTGKLSVADNILTMQFADGETSTWPIAPLQDKGKLVGYGLSNEQHPIEWLAPRQPVAGQIPVGTWAMHEYAGADDKTGQLTGKITVNAAGQFQCDRNGEKQTGKLSVADGVLTMQFEGGDRGQWPIVPLQDRGKTVGYRLNDEQHPMQWLVPRQSVPGKIPVGTWAIQTSSTKARRGGLTIGKVMVNESGQFQCEMNGEKQTGKLSVADGVLTMQFEGGDTGKWPIAPLQDGDKIVGYELRDEQNPMKWLVANNDVPAAEQSTAEQPATEQPATEQPATEQPATEQPAAEQPAAEQPTTEEPATEQPATEEPAPS